MDISKLRKQFYTKTEWKPKAVCNKMMGGGVFIEVLYKDNEYAAEVAVKGALSKMQQIEDLMSPFLPDSDISKINKASQNTFRKLYNIKTNRYAKRLSD